jgi:hypothetical protein
MRWAPPTVAVKESPTESTLAQHLAQRSEGRKVDWWEALTAPPSAPGKETVKEVQKAFGSVPRWD